MSEDTANPNEPPKRHALNDDELEAVTGGAWDQEDEDFYHRYYEHIFDDVTDEILIDYLGTTEPTFEMWMQRYHPNAWRRRTEAGWQ